MYFKEFHACLVFLMLISSGAFVCLLLGLLVCVCVCVRGGVGLEEWKGVVYFSFFTAKRSNFLLSLVAKQ